MILSDLDVAWIFQTKALLHLIFQGNEYANRSLQEHPSLNPKPVLLTIQGHPKSIHVFIYTF